MASGYRARARARHWPLAWAGLDGAIALGLVADTWFDVCTAPAGQSLVFALIDMCVELAEAAACLALAVAVWRDAAVMRNDVDTKNDAHC